MTAARRVRVHTDAEKFHADMLLEAETHDIIAVVEPSPFWSSIFVVLRNDAGQPYGEAINGPGKPGECRVGRDITDQYADAVDAFADACAFFDKKRITFALDLSARDVGLLRLLGGRPLPPAVHTVALSFNDGRVSGGWLVMDQFQAVNLYSSPGWEIPGPSPVFFPARPVSGLLTWPEGAADHVFDCLVPHQSVCLSEREAPKYLAVPTPLAPHWRLMDESVRRERPGEVYLDLGLGHTGSQRLRGPPAFLEEQLRLISVAADRPAGARFEEVLSRRNFVERSHHWSAVSRRIVQAVAQLAQLEPRLSSYVMFWIIDRLPGCVFYP
jgi:hypothetical protein